MFGRPTPTKQTCCPASSRAAATIIISDLLKLTAAKPHGSPRFVGPDAGPTSEGGDAAGRPRAIHPPGGPAGGPANERRARIAPASESRSPLGPAGGPRRGRGRARAW